MILFVYPSQLGNSNYWIEAEKMLDEILINNLNSLENDDNNFLNKLIAEFSTLLPIASSNEVQYLEFAQFNILNKHNSKLTEYRLKSGEEIFLDNLKIKHIISIKNFKSQKSMLIHVQELHIDQDPQTLFLGWIFLNNLCINNFLHYKYEILPIECSNS
ncbi:MAG: DUF2155 domain-containing protein [Rickettsia sp.]|nr:DUF2155 domain-containing protein [Rickettsia sp.]